MNHDQKDETALFLHRVEENLPELKRKMLEQLHESDPVLADLGGVRPSFFVLEPEARRCQGL